MDAVNPELRPPPSPRTHGPGHRLRPPGRTSPSPLGRRPPHEGDSPAHPSPVAPMSWTGDPMVVHERSTSTWHKVAHGGRRFDHTSAQRAANSRGETMDQLLDRNLNELLQELRVAFTGVQILFAFLLSLAFTQRFEDLNDFDIAVYVVALLSTALATMVLIAPVSFHRIVFRQRQKAA